MLQAKNKRAQAGALVFMLAIVAVLLALAFAPTLNEVTTDSMDVSGTSQAGSKIEVVNIKDAVPYNLAVTNIGEDNFKLNNLVAIGKEDSYAAFDGVNDYVRTPTIVNLSNNNPFALCTWFNNNNTNLAQTTILIEGSNASLGNFIRLGLTATERQIYLNIYNSSQGFTFKFHGTPTERNIWYYVCAGYNGTNTSISLNGGLINYGSAEKPNTDSLVNISIGRNVGSAVYHNGSIDEVRIFNRTLSQEEITTLYTSNTIADTTGLVAYYSFDEGNGSIAIDHANYENNGTLVGGVTWVNENDFTFTDYTHNSTSITLTNPSDAYRYLTLSYDWQWYNPNLGEVGGMNCNATTDNFVKAGCWVADIGQMYFIGGILAIAGVIIASRILFS